jgi:hypothetical protein
MSNILKINLFVNSVPDFLNFSNVFNIICIPSYKYMKKPLALLKNLDAVFSIMKSILAKHSSLF